MSNVVAFPEPDYFGVCPTCGRNDGYLNIGREHWFICHKHKVKWSVGENLFSTWKLESDKEWTENSRRVGFYKEIKPRDCPSTYQTPRELTPEESARLDAEFEQLKRNDYERASPSEREILDSLWGEDWKMQHEPT